MGIEQEFEKDLVALIGLPDPEAAEALNRRMAAIERVEQLRNKSYAERGIIAVEFQQRELFKHIGFSTFSQWMSSGYLASRSSIYEAKRDIEALQADVPASVLAGISEKSNMKTLLQCSTNVRQSPQIQAAAQRQDPSSFISTLQSSYPDQHVEQRVPVRFFMEKSCADVIEAALQATMDGEELMSREAALELWAAGAIAEYAEGIECEPEEAEKAEV